MNSRRELAARRAMLLARSHRQRLDAAEAADGIARALWPIAAAEVLVRRASAHPVWVLGAVVAVVVVLRPVRILRIAAWVASAVLAGRRIASPLLGVGALSLASAARAAAREASARQSL